MPREPVPDDVRSASAVSLEVLRPRVDADWAVKAGDLEWDCRTTLDHIANALLSYSANLAARSTERIRPRDGQPNATIPELLSVLGAAAEILARVCETSSPQDRGFHTSGPADMAGFAAMGCDETLVHTSDICAGLGAAFAPPEDLADAVVERLFPWAPEHPDPWERLLWCNGRLELPELGRLEPDWGWWPKPLDEWDGVPRKRTTPPLWT
jgi:hypothetical protein